MPRHGKAAGSVCALVSGGVDSAALVDQLLRKGRIVHPAYLLSGYRWEKAELHWLRRLLAAMASPRLKPLSLLHFPARDIAGDGHWALTGPVPGKRSADSSVYLPGRNLILMTSAAGLCVRRGLGAIAIGTLHGNPFPDAAPVFFKRLEVVLSGAFSRRIRIETPLRTLTKSQVVRSAGDVPWGLTFSCISPKGLRPCGKCNKCEERRKGLIKSRA